MMTTTLTVTRDRCRCGVKLPEGVTRYAECTEAARLFEIDVKKRRMRDLKTQELLGRHLNPIIKERRHV